MLIIIDEDGKVITSQGRAAVTSDKEGKVSALVLTTLFLKKKTTLEGIFLNLRSFNTSPSQKCVCYLQKFPRMVLLVSGNNFIGINTAKCNTNMGKLAHELNRGSVFTPRPKLINIVRIIG